MTNDDKNVDVPISNWTRATGTKPFERFVYFANADHGSQQPAPKPKA